MSDFRQETTGGWSHSLAPQYPEGVDPPPRSPSLRGLQSLLTSKTTTLEVESFRHDRQPSPDQQRLISVRKQLEDGRALLH